MSANSICMGGPSREGSFDSCAQCQEFLTFPFAICCDELKKKIKQPVCGKCQNDEKCSFRNCDRKIIWIQNGDQTRAKEIGISQFRIIDLQTIKCRLCDKRLQPQGTTELQINELWFHLYDNGKIGHKPHVFDKLKHGFKEKRENVLPCISCESNLIHIEFEQFVNSKRENMEISKNTGGEKETDSLLHGRSNACRRNARKVCLAVSCVLGIIVGSVTIALATKD